MIFMETNRLRLRNINKKDADEMFDYRNNEICSKYQRGQTKDYDGIVALAERRKDDSRGRANIQTVMKDILALTKLNYNACIYGGGLPVTLRFSDKIGDILTAIPEVNWAAKPFKYYICPLSD